MYTQFILKQYQQARSFEICQPNLIDRKYFVKKVTHNHRNPSIDYACTYLHPDVDSGMKHFIYNQSGFHRWMSHRNTLTFLKFIFVINS